MKTAHADTDAARAQARTYEQERRRLVTQMQLEQKTAAVRADNERQEARVEAQVMQDVARLRKHKLRLVSDG